MITTARVTRRSDANSALELSARRRREAEQASPNVMDVIDAISGPIPPSGPRTGTHPAAIVVEQKTMDQVVEEIRIKPSTPALHRTAQHAQTYLTGLMLACVFLAGLALGEAL